MTTSSCPLPFYAADSFSREGNVFGRLCTNDLFNTSCCLPCPVQNFVLRQSSLFALHVNDIVNVIGFCTGSFILLVSRPPALQMLTYQSFIVLPQNVTCRSSLGVSIALAQIAINVKSQLFSTDCSFVLYFRYSIYTGYSARTPSPPRTKPRIPSVASKVLFMFLQATASLCWVHLFHQNPF